MHFFNQPFYPTGEQHLKKVNSCLHSLIDFVKSQPVVDRNYRNMLLLEKVAKCFSYEILFDEENSTQCTMTIEGMKKRLNEMRKSGVDPLPPSLYRYFPVLKNIPLSMVINEIEAYLVELHALLLTTLRIMEKNIKALQNFEDLKSSIKRIIMNEVAQQLNVCLSQIECKYPDLDLLWVYEVEAPTEGTDGTSTEDVGIEDTSTRDTSGTKDAIAGDTII
ncbi:hypothetical protein FNV43_RR17622 [Rhamnella rubrinervis]|uniref:Uncharacterized protein n=1 Tax=Rhamnella rubrinervis TaxID=2594499 RepID=A0A8K0GXX0_9ROSA|nr:hypothetical protein FNV43_RR17622 [Rhamnella rubrinervis]